MYYKFESFFRAKKVVKTLGILSPKDSLYLLLFYIIALANGTVNAFCLVAFASLLTNSKKNIIDIIPQNIVNLFNLQNVIISYWDMLLIFLFAFTLNLLLGFFLRYYEELIQPLLTLRIQKKISTAYFYGDWFYLKELSVGQEVGTSVQEAPIVAKYCLSALRLSIFIINAIILTIFAILISYKSFFCILVVSLPLIFAVKWIIKRQSFVSRRLAELRNLFAADLTDRLNGLMQIMVSGKQNYHLQNALRTQPEVVRKEKKIALYQSLLGSLNNLVLFLSIVALVIWSYLNRNTDLPDLTLLASVGLLGYRLFTVINYSIVAIGNLSRLSGSMYPVLNAINIPRSRKYSFIEEPIDMVTLDEISFKYSQGKVLDNISLSIIPGSPLRIDGASGTGKSTLLNLISGLYLPDKGNIYYTGTKTASNYSSSKYRPRIAYVTQDIYLLRGTIRENLLSGLNIDDRKIWEALEKAKAAELVDRLGGLDALSLEAGRSLSGGQRRRLGIAKVLLLNSNIFLLDEITAGLDPPNRKSILATIEQISKDNIVIYVSHDQFELKNQVTLQL